MLLNTIFKNLKPLPPHIYLDFVKEYILDDEMVSLSFKNDDCVLFFTDKRIIYLSLNTFNKNLSEGASFPYSQFYFHSFCASEFSATMTLHYINAPELTFIFQNKSDMFKASKQIMKYKSV